MPSFYPRSATVLNADERRAAYVDGVLHLFQSTLVPDATTPLGTYVANTADFDGYLPITIAAIDWPAVGYSPLGGARLMNCCTQFAYVDGVGHVSNIIGGWYLLDAGGDLRAAGTLDLPASMGEDGDVLPVTMIFEFPTGL